MITAIKIEGFKSLEHVDLRLSGLNLFIGANASGKSNFFDALRVLQGIGYGFTIDEIFNGKPKSASSEVWDGIRGGASRAVFVNGGVHEVKLEVDLRIAADSERSAVFTIAMSPETGAVRNESLTVDGAKIYSSNDLDNPPSRAAFVARYYRGKPGNPRQLEFEKARPLLHQVLRSSHCSDQHQSAVAACARALANTQRVDPSPVVLREYSKANSVKRMGERGENFAALIKTIIADPQARSAYLTWLRELWPTESIEDVAILDGALGEPLFALRERGKDQPAPILSDGTLRFAAITAAFFQPDRPDILTIEEIENGIHASRMRLLVELLRSRAGGSGQQVMATTHSPIVLAWLKARDYATTFFCKRDPSTGATQIRSLDTVPDFTRIVEKQPIGDLFAEGWLEGAL